MGWFSNLFKANNSKVLQHIGQAVDELHLSGEEKQNFKLRVQELVIEREATLEESLRQNLQAKERILTAELQQGDRYTKRARPTVVYFGLGVMAVNYVLVPMLAMVFGLAHRPEAFQLPTEFWVAWGGVVATWSVGRSFEKARASNRASRIITGEANPINLLDDSPAVG